MSLEIEGSSSGSIIDAF